jgi:thiamine biosynthesis lipoprotein
VTAVRRPSPRSPTIAHAAGTGIARTLRVEECMGTVFTIDIRGAGQWTDAVDEAVAWLHHVDAVFSTYTPGSDISRIQRRELRVEEADTDVGVVLDLCAAVQAETDGYFTAMPHRMIDPTGLVKGWAIERASLLLRAHGSADHAVNGGGDIQLAGEAAAGRPWSVGIADPRDRMQVLTTVTGRDFAIATSGTAERGRHLVDPRTGRPMARLLSATVVGPSLTRADGYATAAFVMGKSAPRWADGVSGYEALLVAADGTLEHSAGWRAVRDSH